MRERKTETERERERKRKIEGERLPLVSVNTSRASRRRADVGSVSGGDACVLLRELPMLV